MTVALRPSATRFLQGILVPSVAIEVTNVSTSRLKSPQVAMVMRFKNDRWVLEDCGVPVTEEPIPPTGCDLDAWAVVQLPPGRPVTDRSSQLAYGLDWPYGGAREPGSLAVVVAFGEDGYNKGAAANLEVTGP